ncbi:MAG: DUF3795 domain-containing protein [Candidatus Cloacimonetes bacterium]|nr:DUF3795 domain-containing protein [Candidatus Cloacimonadota bacterium]
MKYLSKCGVCCSTDCKAYKIECDGCNELEGKVAWAKFYGKILCPIYECAEQMEFASCKECGKAPCEIWISTRNPDFTDKEFQTDINSRLKNFEEQDNE